MQSAGGLRAEVLRVTAVVQRHPKVLGKVCKLDAQGETVLKQAMTELGLSARAHDKLLRISRTIADLVGMDDIHADHLCEAVHYRRLDRQL